MALDSPERRARAQTLVDLGVAAAVLVLSVLPLVQERACGCGAESPWAYLLVATQSLPLVWRRRAPVPTAVVIGIATTVYGMSELPDPPIPYAALISLYTVAAYASRRLALVVGGVVAVVVAVSLAIDWPQSDLEDAVVLYPVFATAWLLGDNVRVRRERATELEARAAAAERTRAAEAERAVVEERNRIAREMHDVVAHHVSLMVVQAEAGPVGIERDPARAVEAFAAISATGKQAMVEMRRLLGVLRSDEPSARAPQPGLDRLSELIAGVQATGLAVELEVVGVARAVPPAVDLSAYRLLQEALTNASRHSGATRVRVRVAYGPDAVELAVEDDGPGLRGGAVRTPGDPDSRSTGHGLVAMRERVAILGGALSVGPNPAGGWSVAARLPTTEVPAR